MSTLAHTSIYTYIYTQKGAHTDIDICADQGVTLSSTATLPNIHDILISICI